MKPNFVNDKEYLIDRANGKINNISEDEVSIRPNEDSQCDWYWGNVILRITKRGRPENRINAYLKNSGRNTFITRDFISILTGNGEAFRIYLARSKCINHNTPTYLSDHLSKLRNEIEQEKNREVSDKYFLAKTHTVSRIFLDSEINENSPNKQTIKSYYETSANKKLVVRNDVDPLFYPQYEKTGRSLDVRDVRVYDTFSVSSGLNT